MKHEDFRHKIKSGDLLGFSHGSFKSWREFKTLMVRVFTASSYSHVAVAVVLGGRVFALEAVKPYSRIFPLSLLGDYYHVPTKAVWTQAVEDFAMSKAILGVPYSELTAMVAYAQELEKGNATECAALVIAVLEQAQVNLGRMSRPDTVMAYAQLDGETTFVENGGYPHD